MLIEKVKLTIQKYNMIEFGDAVVVRSIGWSGLYLPFTYSKSTKERLIV